MVNHNNDPTGALGENGPAWLDEMQQFLIWQDGQPTRGRNQQNHRAEMRNVQQELGVVQAPLGPGNAPL